MADLIEKLPVEKETVQVGTLVSEGDSLFKVEFLYNSHSLETDSMPNSTSKEDVEATIKKAVEKFKTETAEDNMTLLKETFENKELEL